MPLPLLAPSRSCALPAFAPNLREAKCVNVSNRRWCKRARRDARDLASVRALAGQRRRDLVPAPVPRKSAKTSSARSVFLPVFLPFLTFFPPELLRLTLSNDSI